MQATTRIGQAVAIRPASVFEQNTLFDGTPGLIAERDGSQVGQLGYRLYDHCIYAHSALTTEGESGVFVMLVQRVRGIAKAKGVPVWFQVSPPNLRLLRLLKRHARLINATIELK